MSKLTLTDLKVTTSTHEYYPDRDASQINVEVEFTLKCSIRGLNPPSTTHPTLEDQARKLIQARIIDSFESMPLLISALGLVLANPQWDELIVPLAKAYKNAEVKNDTEEGKRIFIENALPTLLKTYFFSDEVS